MNAADVGAASARAMLNVSGGIFGFSLADSLPASVAALTHSNALPNVLSIPLLSWAGIIALLGVAVEWGRVRENLRGTNERIESVERSLAEMKKANEHLQESVNFLTQALAARGFITVSPPSFQGLSVSGGGK